jgi:hypothetical protein
MMLLFSNSGSSGPLDNHNIVLIGQITHCRRIGFLNLIFQILTKEGELKKVCG